MLVLWGAKSKRNAPHKIFYLPFARKRSRFS
ncbi:MAG: hypothetical protein PWP60_1429, partial [Candidatus Atribacteria bacterium]|nr:hypothetical protein [Candidatus Atribacteria bacterium]